MNRNEKGLSSIITGPPSDAELRKQMDIRRGRQNKTFTRPITVFFIEVFRKEREAEFLTAKPLFLNEYFWLASMRVRYDTVSFSTFFVVPNLLPHARTTGLQAI